MLRRPGFFFVVLLATLVAAASATVVASNVSARLLVEGCGLEVACEHAESELLITVTYLWPGGDPATGFVEEFNAQTCIRAWAAPATLRQTVSGYAFGGDCSTNDSGTTDEFYFTAPGPVLFCAQVDAFIGSRDLGSSNLACVEVSPLTEE
jgi:hypothetical protein